MREENIKQALAFLQKKETSKDGKGKEIPFEEKKKFLEGKLSEEEIGEVMRRFNEQPNDIQQIIAPSRSYAQKDSVLQNVQNSPIAEQRLQHTQSLFMQSVNVASIAILSTLGVTYVLDKIKDRQDKNLREEIKDRLDATLRDSQQRIRSLEAELDQQKALQVSKESVEKIVGERFEQFEQGKVVGDAKNRALNLKLRASQVSNPSQLGQYNREESQMLSKEDIDGLKLEMVRELREMKQNLKDSMQSNTDIIRELKDMNVSMLRQQPLSSGMLQPSLSQSDPKEEVKGADVPAPVVEHRIQLTEEDKQKIAELYKTWLAAFEPTDKVSLIKFMKMPLSVALKEPSKRIIDLSNAMYKKFHEKKPDEFNTFLTGVGYTGISQSRYQFMKPVIDGDGEIPEEMKFQGNIEVLETLVKLFNEEQVSV